MLDLNVFYKGNMGVFPGAQEETFQIKAVIQLAATSVPSPKEIYLLADWGIWWFKKTLLLFWYVCEGLNKRKNYS